jgi:hypothetical protein
MPFRGKIETLIIRMYEGRLFIPAGIYTIAKVNGFGPLVILILTYHPDIEASLASGTIGSKIQLPSI